MRPVMSALAVAVAVVAGGCSNPVSPGLVTGKWAETFSVPGNSFEMTLVAAGTEVTGTGHACGEAGPCSDIDVTGTSDASGVHLTLVSTQTVPTPGATSMSAFDGRLVSANTLRGTLVQAGIVQISPDPVLITFHRE